MHEKNIEGKANVGVKNEVYLAYRCNYEVTFVTKRLRFASKLAKYEEWDHVVMRVLISSQMKNERMNVKFMYMGMSVCAFAHSYHKNYHFKF